LNLVFMLVGVGLLSFPALASSAVIVRPPAERARVTTAALIGGAIAVELALLLTAIPTVLDWLRVEGLSVVCHHIVDRLAAGGPIIGWLSLALGSFLLALVILTVDRSRRRISRARIAPWFGAHEERDTFELVIVPTSHLVAVSVPGAHPQVVVSDGMAACLDRGGLEALIAHEAAHLQCRHRRFLVVALLIERLFGWLPDARASAAVLRDAVEEWADDVAATGVVDRRVALCGALRTVAAAAQPDRHIDTQAERRMNRLVRVAPRSRTASAATRGAYGLAGAVALIGVVLFTTWLRTSHHLVALSGYCPT
jgi:hypothetical protein